MEKTLVFTIKKGISKNGTEYYYLENNQIKKRVFLTDLELEVLKLLKLL